ncbi:MAG: ComEC/Rec2 family competence protein [Oscillospiraceae bacterium]|nr:ComEC/Rec2 family competence protein [Oscillospiraceae bacterium]
MTRKLVYVSFGYMGGLLIAATAGGLTVPLTVGMLIVGAVLMLIKKIPPVYTAVIMTVCLSAAAGSVVYSVVNVPPQMGPASFDGVVTEADTEGVPFYIVRHDGQLTGIYIYGEYSLIRGDRIHVDGTLSVPKNESYMRSKGILAVMYSPEITVIRKETGLFRWMDGLRHISMSTIRYLGAGDAGEYIIGMLFGSRYWSISSSALSDLYAAGAGHTAAVSGLHLSIAAMIAAAVAGNDRRLRFIAVMLTGAVIALAADLTVPVIRAYIMTAIVYGAGLSRRRSDPLNSLAIAVLVILIHSPLCVTGASFMLSLSGTFGAAVLSPMAERELCRIKAEREGTERMFTHIHPVLRSAVFILCTQAAVLPASMVFFDQISAVSPIVNMLVIPLCAPALFFSYIGAAAGGAVSKLFFIFAVVIAKVILWLCHIAASIASPLPSGAILPEMVVGGILACLAGAVGGKKTLLPTALSTVSLIMIAGTVVYCTSLQAPQAYIEDGYALIRTASGSAAIDTGNDRYDLKRDAARYGLHPSAVLCTKGQAKKYASDFPDADIYIIEGDTSCTIDGIAVHIDGHDIQVDMTGA